MSNIDGVLINGKPLADILGPDYKFDPLQDVHALPPAMGQAVIPPVQSVISLLNAGKRFFMVSDEALRHSQENARKLLRNLSIRDPLQARILAVAQLPFSIEPPDKKDKLQVAVAKELQCILEEIPYWTKYVESLCWAIWFGRAAVQNLYYWNVEKGYPRLCVRDWLPINGDSLVYSWDSDEVAIRTGGFMGVRSYKTDPADFSRVHVLEKHERDAHVIHVHQVMGGDFLDPQTIGKVKGVGIRDAVYWIAWLQGECLAILQEFLERQGTGFTVFYFEAGNQESYEKVRALAESQSYQQVIVWPREQGMATGAAGIERIEPTLAGLQNFKFMLEDYYGSQLRRFIQGQDATSKPTPGGLGSTAADVQEGTFFRLVSYDARNLEETLTRQLLWVIQQKTFPEYRHFKCKLKLATDKPDPEKYMKAVKDFIDVGGTVIESQARQVMGFTEPQPDDKVLGGKQQEMPPGGPGLPPGGGPDLPPGGSPPPLGDDNSPPPFGKEEESLPFGKEEKPLPFERGGEPLRYAKEFDESKVKRDHGQFASKEGTSEEKDEDKGEEKKEEKDEDKGEEKKGEYVKKAPIDPWDTSIDHSAADARYEHEIRPDLDRIAKSHFRNHYEKDDRVQLAQAHAFYMTRQHPDMPAHWIRNNAIRKAQSDVPVPGKKGTQEGYTWGTGQRTKAKQPLIQSHDQEEGDWLPTLRSKEDDPATAAAKNEVEALWREGLTPAMREFADDALGTNMTNEQLREKYHLSPSALTMRKNWLEDSLRHVWNSQLGEDEQHLALPKKKKKKKEDQGDQPESFRPQE